MAMPETAWSQHQHARWMRPDAARWQKPALVKTPEVSDHHDNSHTNVSLKALQLGAASVRVAVADLRFALAFQHLLDERKYSPSQPRVPTGDPRGGQWTRRRGSQSGGDDEDESEDDDEGGDESGSDPFDSFAEASEEDAADDDDFDLSDILSALGDELREAFSFLDFLSDDDRAQVQLVSDNNNPSGDPDPFPQIPEQKPESGKEANSILRNIANWASRNAGKIGVGVDVVYGIAEQVEWVAKSSASLRSYKDPPRTLEELQERATLKSENGYENHHIVKKSSEQDGISRAQIYSPDNEARIPTLIHHDITAYYNRANVDLPDGTKGKVSDYLRDKSFEERRDFGLKVMRDFGALK